MNQNYLLIVFYIFRRNNFPRGEYPSYDEENSDLLFKVMTSKGKEAW
jgi:hypothetical protein